MYLKSFKISNYRKFGSDNNEINFVGGSNLNNKDDNEISNIASSSTLIIGKNNTGKTTITNALNQLVNRSPRDIKSSDFNMGYLRKLLIHYSEFFGTAEANDVKRQLPRLDFELKVGIKDKNKVHLTNLASFISLNNCELQGSISIRVSYQLEEEEEFFANIRELVFKNELNLDLKNQLPLLCEQIDSAVFKVIFKNEEDRVITGFSLSSLFSVKVIEANRHFSKTVLSDLYHKIVKSGFDDSLNIFEDTIKELNTTITDHKNLCEQKVVLQDILNVLEGTEHVGMDLQGGVTSDKLFSSLIKYVFMEGNDYIPEDQFGLGYINLLNIIGHITHYMDTYELDSHLYRINLLFIEEPEVFMHPQMQEFFITRIDKALKKILEKNISNELRCQLVITTHSSHIVNSKIHSSQSFDSINYIASIANATTVVGLRDEELLGCGISPEQLKFLRTHIKYKVSELFFADAVIFVEGMTEATLLPYFLECEPELRNYHISIFNIDGAHSQVYLPLIKKLMIPCLIITDLDIKRSDKQKRSFMQLTILREKVTTNNSLIAHFGIDKIPYKSSPQKDNRYYAFQGKINGSYATSLEEALILTNYDNQILQKVLLDTIPNIFKGIVQVGEEFNYNNLLKRSYELQSKLGANQKKSEFSSKLLCELIINEDSAFKIPQYIQDGFNWLSKTLNADKGRHNE